MIQIEPTPNYAGVSITGDFYDFDQLYESLHTHVGQEGEHLHYHNARMFLSARMAVLSPTFPALSAIKAVLSTTIPLLSPLKAVLSTTFPFQSITQPILSTTTIPFSNFTYLIPSMPLALLHYESGLPVYILPVL